ncbi:mitochondrial arginine transporter BAC1 isoform X4 [Syzygium oleosum]|uniref:mitochondrial arginine transporter BAC1 isoform X4 n=1 Tax=Syzygium oleosum TaxID=219896 RepID=UPI0024B8D48B|nr:mitochondrial arginine transporter BAC1 isoform X4 [Syzygium oleosum]
MVYTVLHESSKLKELKVCIEELLHPLLEWPLRVHFFLEFIHKQNSPCRHRGLQTDLPQPRVIIPAAAYGGAMISFVLCPSELVKCRMQVQGTDSVVPKSSRYSGPLDCAIKTVKADGVTGIFRGGFATLLRESIGNAVFFSTYEYVRHYMHLQLHQNSDSSQRRHVVDIGIGVVTGGLGGIAFWCAVLPLDVAKTIIQTAPDRNDPRNPFRVLSSVSDHNRIHLAACQCHVTIQSGIPPSFKLGLLLFNLFLAVDLWESRT